MDPTSPSANCDRILGSQSFFGSPEFQIKGFYVFRFYKLAFNRLPEYLEIVSDMSFVAGATQQEVFQRKAQLAVRFTQRQEFMNTFGALSNSAFVNALLGRYQLTQITTPDPQQPDDGTVRVTLTAADLTDTCDASRIQMLQRMVVGTSGRRYPHDDQRIHELSGVPTKVRSTVMVITFTSPNIASLSGQTSQAGFILPPIVTELSIGFTPIISRLVTSSV